MLLWCEINIKLSTIVVINIKGSKYIMLLEKKVAVITGGARGIGAAIARQFAAQGATVIVNYQANSICAERICNEINTAGGVAKPFKADISKPKQIAAMFEFVAETYGHFDILVNNAGIAVKQQLSEIQPEDLFKQLEVNIAGLVLCTQHAASILKSNGRVINISSIAAKGGSAFPVYSATKAAVNTLTKSFAMELGPKQITVNAIAPSAVETDLYFEVGLDKNKAQTLASTPLGFLGNTQDIASSALFFASDQARWITGEVLQVSGGRLM